MPPPPMTSGRWSSSQRRTDSISLRTMGMLKFRGRTVRGFFQSACRKHRKTPPNPSLVNIGQGCDTLCARVVHVYSNLIHTIICSDRQMFNHVYTDITEIIVISIYNFSFFWAWIRKPRQQFQLQIKERSGFQLVNDKELGLLSIF